MKKYRKIMAADAPEQSQLATLLDQIDDDYDYLVAGLEKLDRSGSAASNAGAEIAQGIADAINNAITQIADLLQEEI